VLVRAEPGARGARGERLVYEITESGRQRFNDLLREVLGTFTPVHTGVDVAVAFLGMLPCVDAVDLLRRRRQAVAHYRQTAAADLGEIRAPLPTVLAADHLLSIIDAELAWIDRSVKRLLAEGSADGNSGNEADHV